MSIADVIAICGGLVLIGFAGWSQWPRKTVQPVSNDKWLQRGGLSPEGMTIGLALDHAHPAFDDGGGH